MVRASKVSIFSSSLHWLIPILSPLQEIEVVDWGSTGGGGRVGWATGS